MGLTKLIDLPLLDRFLSKIKLMTSHRTAAIPFGQVDSTSTATAFTVQIPEITELYDGVCMYVKNGVVTSASGFTLQLNNFTALPVYQTMAAATRGTTIFNVNYTMLFVYNSSRVDGGCWDIFYGYNSNDNTIAYNIRNYQAARTMKSVLYRYMFVFTALDGTLVPSCGTSNSTSTSKTLSTVAFDPFGPVYYYATTTTVSAGSAPGAGNFWRAYSACNMRYAWNVSSTALTTMSPVFVRLAPQSDGTVKLDGNNCIVQALPNTADGKVYMYLGHAYSQYQIELNYDHPLFCYRNGRIQQWTGIESELDSIGTQLAAIPEEFLVTVTYSNGSYTADKTISEIVTAHTAGKDVKLLTNYGTKLSLTDITQSYADFSGLVNTTGSLGAFHGVSYRITSSGTGYSTSVLSKVTIELTQSSGTSYAFYDSNLHLSDIYALDQAGTIVEILADGQKYPRVIATSAEAIFGRIDPYNNVYVMFKATQSDTFTRSEVELSGGGGDSPTPMGQTPITLTNDMSVVRLQSSSQCSYTIQSDTVVEFDFEDGTPTGATLTKDGSFWKLQCNSGVANWYGSYIDVTATGLAVNTVYNFIFDGRGVPANENTKESIGHFILYDANSNTLATRGATDGSSLLTYQFTASTTSVRLRWYPASNNYFESGVSVGRCLRAYINRQGTSSYSDIVDLSGTFTGQTTVYNVPKGAVISSNPSCSVFAIEEKEAAQKLLHGKKVVCFGDSLFGMYRGDTAATTFLADYTGATVYNVGFGGCRMSVHPTTGYAAFSMWALADAVATDTWTTQDSQASSGSDYFPDQLALLKSIDFDEVDYIVIHYGTNDFAGNVAIDNSSSPMSTSTICGALRYSLNKLMTAYPDIQIFVSLPVFRYWTSSGTTTYSDTYQNSNSVTIPDVNKALAQVAYDFHVPVIDGYSGMSVNSYNASDYYVDGTHHNELGRQRFGEFIGKCLTSSSLPDVNPQKYVVTFSLNGSTFVSDKTYAEIAAAVQAGKTVIGVAPTISPAIFPLVACDTTYGAVFSLILSLDSHYATQYGISVMPNGNVYYNTHDIYYNGVSYDSQTLTDAQKAQARTNIGAGTGTYSKPSDGIPATDLVSAVQTTLSNAVLYTAQSDKTAAEQTQARTNIGAGTYSKPSNGIPSTDMTSTVQTSLGKADNAIQKTDNAIQYTMNTSTSNGVTTVTIDKGAEEILTTCVSQKKVYFVSGTKFFTPTEVNLLTYSVNLICEIDGMCYETTISPSGASAMTGTLKTYPSGTYPITVTYSNSTYTCDRTYSQIYDASVLGKSMPVTVIDGSERTIGWVQYTYSSEVALCYITSWETLPILVTLLYDSNGITKTQHNLQIMPETITNSNTSVTLTPSDNQVYDLTASSLSSLTISSETGSYSIIFKSGSTATTFTKPNSLIMPDGFTIEADKRYEINVSDHYAVVASWAVST